MKTLIKILCLSLFGYAICFPAKFYKPAEIPGLFSERPNGLIDKNIKNVTTANYIYLEKFGDFIEVIDTSISPIRIFKFNSDGMIEDLSFFNSNNEVSTSDIFKCHKRIYSYGSNKNIESISNYTIDGSLVDVEPESFYSKVEAKKIFKYDEQNRLINSIKYDADGSICDKCYNYYTEYEYDNKNNIISEMNESKDGAVEKITFKYDSNSNLIDKSIYDFEGNPKEYLGYKSILKYDDNDNLIEIAKYNSDGSNYENDYGWDGHKIIHIYNDKNFLVETIILGANNEKFNNRNPHNHIKNVYDSENNLTKRLYYLNDDLNGFDEYKYDFNNNPIERKSYKIKNKFGEKITIPSSKITFTYRY